MYHQDSRGAIDRMMKITNQGKSEFGTALRITQGVEGKKEPEERKGKEREARERGGKEEWVNEEAMDCDGIYLDETVPVTD